MPMTTSAAQARRLELLRRLPSVLLIVVLAVVGLFVMFHHEIPLNEQPYPDSREYATSANQLAHGHGYTTPIIDNGATNHWAKTENPPRYSPGYPFALSPFGLLGRFPGNIEFGAKVMVLLMLVSVAWAAVEIAGPIAAVLAVLLVGSGSFTSESAQLVLSDAFAAGLAVAVLALVKRQGPFAAYAAGFLAGYGVLVRVNGFVVVACLLLCSGAEIGRVQSPRPHRRWWLCSRTNGWHLDVPGVRGTATGCLK